MKNFLLVILGILLFSCNYITNKYYTNPEQNFALAKTKAPYDAIIIPGFPHYSDSTTLVIKARVNWAVYLYEKGIAKNIIFSGAAVYTPFIEAKIMALYAEEMGVPSEHIYIDSLAEHSVENIYYSYRLGEKKGFNSFALATDVGQSSFLYSINNQRFHFNLDFIPIVFDSLIIATKPLPFINENKAKVNSFVSIINKEKLITRLKATKGKKVKKLLKQEKKEKSSQK